VANTKSAAKRARQSVKRNARNRTLTSTVRTQVRKTREVFSKGDAASIDTELKNAVSALNRAASKGVLHKRAASRKVSRLAAAAAAAKAPKA
jgi:small subunit ribosomal protein S20